MEHHLGKLTLIPTSLDEEKGFDLEVIDFLKSHLERDKLLILVESHKLTRRRWINSGLPRSMVDHFLLFNKKTESQTIQDILDKLEKGYEVFMMSDSGLPAFCDPGVELVCACHERNIRVSCFPLHNSVVQAVSLSGFKMDQFYFAGFPPIRGEERDIFLKKILDDRQSSIVMDTPYRLRQLIQEVQKINPHRRIFLALNLNQPTEELILDLPLKVIEKIKDRKAEFIMITEPMVNEKRRKNAKS